MASALPMDAACSYNCRVLLVILIHPLAGGIQEAEVEHGQTCSRRLRLSHTTVAPARESCSHPVAVGIQEAEAAHGLRTAGGDGFF